MPVVFPVPGYWLSTQAAVEHDCDDAFCTASGAFTTTKPPPLKAVQADTEAPEIPGPSDSPEE